jgi:hypothetical protein
VIQAIRCDIAAAAKDTKGKAQDLSKVVITGKLTFSLVKKNSVGASLAVAAIPVFAGTIAPSLEASRLTENTESDEVDFTAHAGSLTPCEHSSSRNWLTSKAILRDTLDGGGLTINKVTTIVSFVVTYQKSAGLKLNIIPVTIGPSPPRLPPTLNGFQSRSTIQKRKPTPSSHLRRRWSVSKIGGSCAKRGALCDWLWHIITKYRNRVDDADHTATVSSRR